MNGSLPSAPIPLLILAAGSRGNEYLPLQQAPLLAQAGAPCAAAAVSFPAFEELESLPHLTAPRGRKTRSSSEDERGSAQRKFLYLYSQQRVCF